jgi:hypothetical protein
LEDDRKPTNGTHENTDEKPSEASFGSIKEAKPDSERSYSSSTHEQKHPLEWAIAIMLFFTLIATATAAYYTRQQWLTADEVKIRQLRAYVLVSQSEITVQAPATATIILQLKNFGLTPAYKFVGWHCIIVGRFGRAAGNIQIETEFPSPTNNERIGQKTILGPQDIKHILFPAFCDNAGATTRPITEAEATRIRDGAAAIYLYGEATYLDAFEMERHLKYRIIGPGNGTTFDHPEGNEAD